MLTFSKGPLSQSVDFEIWKYPDNTIDNSGFYVKFTGDFIIYNHTNNNKPGGMTFKGSGVTIFSGVSTYEGPTTVEEGTLRFGSAVAIPKGSKTTIERGGTVDLNDQDGVEIDSLTLNGGTLQNNGSSRAVLITGFDVSADGFIDVPNIEASLELGGVLSGSGGLTFKGNGQTILSGKNTYTGPTVIEEGALTVTGSLSDEAVVDVKAGATYAVESDDTIASISGAGRVENAAGLTVSGTAVISDLDNNSVNSKATFGLLQGTEGKDRFINKGSIVISTKSSTNNNKGECGDVDVDCYASIDLKGGDDLIETGEKLSILVGDVIDGGDIGREVNGKWEGEMNVFLASEVPTGFKRDQLKNFAVVQWGEDYYPDNGSPNCEAPLTVTEDQACELLTGEEGSGGAGNVVTINAKQATLRVGVGDLSYDPQTGSKAAGTGSNEYRVLNGNLSAVVLKGAG